MHVQSTLNPSPPTVDGTWDDRRLQEEYLIKILDNLHRFDSFAKLADWINLSNTVGPKPKTLAKWYLHYKKNQELPYETARFYEELKNAVINPL